MKKRNRNYPSVSLFIPDIWSQKVLSKFFEQEMFSPISPIRSLTEDIKKLSEAGLTPEQIAPLLEPDKYFDEGWSIIPWKKWNLGTGSANDKVKINQIYGNKVLRAGAIGRFENFTLCKSNLLDKK